MSNATPWIGTSADHYENFPVASWLLPRSARPPIAAVYAFARYADDVADEGQLPDQQRLSELERLRLAVTALSPAPADPCAPHQSTSHAAVSHPMVSPLGIHLTRHQLQASWLLDLLSAFEQDVRIKRHSDRAHLMNYCRRSADPIGKIVLQVFGRLNPRTEPASNAICSALQLINFLQDFGNDWRVGRLYIPQDELAHAGVDEADIEQSVRAGSASRPLRRVIAAQADFARALLVQGQPLLAQVPFRLSLELRAIVAGGHRVLDKLAASDFDPIAARPKLSKRDIVPALLRGLR